MRRAKGTPNPSAVWGLTSPHISLFSPCALQSEVLGIPPAAQDPPELGEKREKRVKKQQRSWRPRGTRVPNRRGAWKAGTVSWEFQDPPGKWEDPKCFGIMGNILSWTGIIQPRTPQNSPHGDPEVPGGCRWSRGPAEFRGFPEQQRAPGW